MIEDSIRNQALTNSDNASVLTALIANKFFFNTAHNANDNYILLRLINDPTAVQLHMEENQRDAIIQFDCYSKTPQKAQQIATALNTIFNKKGFADNDVKVQLALKKSRRPDFETDTGLYLESLEYVFYYHPINP